MLTGGSHLARGVRVKSLARNLDHCLCDMTFYLFDTLKSPGEPAAFLITSFAYGGEEKRGLGRECDLHAFLKIVILTLRFKPSIHKGGNIEK